jgi:hypothetical protein
MAEPQPSEVHEGAADPHAPTSTAQDRKAAAALSALDALDGENGAKKEVDGKALDKAMQGLSVTDKKEGEKKNVKIEPSDVTLLVRQTLVRLGDATTQENRRQARECRADTGPGRGTRYFQAESDGTTARARWQRRKGYDSIRHGSTLSFHCSKA